MCAEETKHDLFLKRVQVTIAILAGLTALILGIYNIKKNILTKSVPEVKPAVVVQPAQTSPLRSAFEEAGASFIRSAASKYTHSKDQPTAQSTPSTQN